MRLLVLSSSFPYPVDVGRKAVLSGFLEYAVTTLGADNVLLMCVSSDRSEEDAVSLSPCRVVFFSPASAVLRAALVVLNSLLLRRRAIQEMLVAAPGIRSRIVAIFDRFDPDILLVDTVRMVQHVPLAARQIRRSVLYLDDLYSLRYRRILSAMKDHPEFPIDAVGTFDRFLPRPLRCLIHSRAVQHRLLALESEILARREVAMPRQFDEILLLNADEAARLVQETGAKNVSTVMPFVTRAHRTEAFERSFTGDPTFLFLGNLRYSANAHGLSLFLRQAMSMFLAQVPDGRLLVVGTGADRELRELGRRFEQQVSFLDYVDNLDALCGSAAGMVVPLLFGSGVKIKVIEALARGLPMVSTHIGIEGLGLEPGTHCLVEDDLSGFADAMVRLLDPELNADLAQQCFAFYKSRLAPAAVAPIYRTALFGDRATGHGEIRRPDRDNRLKLGFEATG